MPAASNGPYRCRRSTALSNRRFSRCHDGRERYLHRQWEGRVGEAPSSRMIRPSSAADFFRARDGALIFTWFMSNLSVGSSLQYGLACGSWTACRSQPGREAKAPQGRELERGPTDVYPDNSAEK